MEQESSVKQNGYSLTKEWFDFALNNPDIVSGNHTALYLWIVQVNNITGWKEKFGLTVREGMEGMSCKSRTTYYKCFQNLIDWGFITIVLASKNQHQCNVITLIKSGIPKNGTPESGIPNNEQCPTKKYTHIDTHTSTHTGTILKPVNIKNKKVVETQNVASSSVPFITIDQSYIYLDLKDDGFALHAVRQTGYSINQLDIISKEFMAEQKAVGKRSWSDVPDLRKHFINWSKKKLEISKREHPPTEIKSKAQLSESQKRQIEEAKMNHINT
jgi:hypothetical protein